MRELSGLSLGTKLATALGVAGVSFLSTLSVTHLLLPELSSKAGKSVGDDAKDAGVQAFTLLCILTIALLIAELIKTTCRSSQYQSSNRRNRNTVVFPDQGHVNPTDADKQNIATETSPLILSA